MENLYRGLVILCTFLHLCFLALEMFFWTKPLGLKVFDLTPAMAEQTKTLAFNQGLYNGFLAAGLIWGFVAGEYEIHLFFLVCMVIAGIVGALTASPSIFFVQALPAILALSVLLLMTLA